MTLIFLSGFYMSMTVLEMRCVLKDFEYPRLINGFRNFQEIAYYLGGGRASVYSISCVIILTFALYPGYYFSKRKNV